MAGDLIRRGDTGTRREDTLLQRQAQEQQGVRTGDGAGGSGAGPPGGLRESLARSGDVLLLETEGIISVASAAWFVQFVTTALGN